MDYLKNCNITPVNVEKRGQEISFYLHSSFYINSVLTIVGCFIFTIFQKLYVVWLWTLLLLEK